MEIITNLKRYLVFAGDEYYPGGGWKDFDGSADTVEGAMDIVAKYKSDWWHIVDMMDGTIVKRNS